jgi:parallel beta-helix repeat protein
MDTRNFRLWAGVALLIVGPALVEAVGQTPSGADGRAEIRVGVDEGDIRGSDNRALQAAIAYVAKLGGGTVWIGAGQYQLRHALVLQDRVQVRGVAGKTIFTACPGATALLAADGDCNERQITLQGAGDFQVGDGVAIQDDQAHGFAVTTATLLSRTDAGTFRISRPLYLDYLVSKKASVSRVFPLVGGWDIKNAVVDGLILDGNRDQTPHLNGCRGGGIYLFECENVVIRNCTVRNYNGDGISFQVSQHVTVEDCVSENNAGLGLHPGSGSQHPIVRRNRSLRNGDDGLFVCWRVKYGQFEDNEIRDNKGAGVSIGHKDTDNQFRGNTICNNGRAGVLFREESEAMGAHRNVFENNRILDNCTSRRGHGSAACIVIEGPHHDLVFRNNMIGCTRAGAGAVGILAGQDSTGLRAKENQFMNLQQILTLEKPKVMKPTGR